MPGPAPKPASTRQRRNKTSTAATLVADPSLRAPTLPEQDAPWHSMTTQWWSDVWTSPMAPEFDDSDKHGLFMLAKLVDAFWWCPEPKLAKDLAAEVRQQGQRFGLSPIDRRRLQWEIERTQEAQDKGSKRRAAPPDTARSRRRTDPRASLHAV